MHDLSKSNPGNFSLKLDVSDYVAFPYALNHVVAKSPNDSALGVCAVSREIILIWTDMYGRS